MTVVCVSLCLCVFVCLRLRSLLDGTLVLSFKYTNSKMSRFLNETEFQKKTHKHKTRAAHRTGTRERETMFANGFVNNISIA